MNITQIQKLAFETAESKGWHEDYIRDSDGNIRTLDLLGLLHLAESEVNESELETAHFYYDNNGKPEGKIIELADVVIRLCDTREVLHIFDAPKHCSVPLNPNVHHAIYRIGEASRKYPVTSYEVEQAIGSAIHETYAAASVLGYPPHTFEKFIAIKQEYNKTRTRRHGGKLA